MASNNKGSLFKGLDGYFETKTLAPKRRKILEDLWISHGGTLATGTKGSTIIFTNEHRKGCRGASKYSVEWISKCIEEGRLVDKEEYSLKRANTTANRSTSPKKTKTADTREENNNEFTMPDGFVNSFYDCHRSTPLTSPNDEFISQLERIENNRYLTGNPRSQLSYRRAISALRAYPRKIQSGEEASKIIAVGKKVSAMLDEFIRTGCVQEAEDADKEPSLEMLADLCRVHGVGPAVAAKLLQKGIYSVEDLRVAHREGRIHLSSEQEMGLMYCEDMDQLMSMDQVENIAYEIIEAMKKSKQQPKCRIEIVGGYRRGKTSSHDLDILISPTEQEGVEGILEQLVADLRSDNRIIAILQFSVGHSHKLPSSKETMDRLDRCLCVYHSPNDPVHRRVDIIVAPQSQFWYAMLGWTGSRQFERSIRLFASRERGMTLSSHALQDKLTKEVLPAKSEEEIFHHLRLPFIPPNMRNC